jgi:DNA-binding transcriptional MerR regulator
LIPMAEGIAPVEIPNRALFKSAEVCDLVKVQPYVLRSWESEFPELGIAKTAGGPRFYRRVDVEQVVRIKHLLLVDGLTLAGARRKLQEEATPIAADAPVIDELMGEHARERLTEVKRGLRSILELLAGRTSSHDFMLTAPPIKRIEAPSRRAIDGAKIEVASAKGKSASSRDGVVSTATRRKR